jgi:Fis family transcriptional regulator
VSRSARKEARRPELQAAGGASGVPLRDCVRMALDAYLVQLAGEDPQDLYRMVLSEVEAPMLEAVLAHTGGNQTRAAAVLGMNRGTLRKKLRLYGLE